MRNQTPGLRVHCQPGRRIGVAQPAPDLDPGAGLGVAPVMAQADFQRRRQRAAVARRKAAAALECSSARRLDADRRGNVLILLDPEGSDDNAEQQPNSRFS